MTAGLDEGWKDVDAALSAGPIPAPERAIRGKRVLITGAGGSIGSALARSIAALDPERILLLDSSEQALYQIDRMLAGPHTPVLGNVCDAAALEEMFERHKPQAVFHAAAFKHVPLMESHPFAAVENNAVGSFLLARTAARHGAKQMILVSTDKAVDPAGIMGASKRAAERTALAVATPVTKIKAVRLGNVYGSQGSVAPLFEEQIAQGKAVTVTHPAATRYFLSMDHAVSLLLFALREEFPSAILVPELAGPVRVEEVARGLMRRRGTLSSIVYTGLRPGEKLHERLVSSDELPLGEAGAPLRAIRCEGMSADEAVAVIGELRSAIGERDLARLLDGVKRMVPGYEPSGTVLAAQGAECRV